MNQNLESDFHKLVVTALKTSFRKTAPRELHYRDYNKSDADDFKTELKQDLATSSSNYQNFEQAFLALLDKHAPYNSKKIRANQVPYMTKKLRKAIMERSQLKIKYFKTNTAESLWLYRNKRVFVVSCIRKKERKKYYNSLKLNRVTDNKAFLSDKGASINKISLLDDDKVISGDKQLCKTFSNFFQEAVKTVDVTGNFSMSNYYYGDPLNNAIRKYENHPSVKKISQTINYNTTNLSFTRCW